MVIIFPLKDISKPFRFKESFKLVFSFLKKKKKKKKKKIILFAGRL